MEAARGAKHKRSNSDPLWRKRENNRRSCILYTPPFAEPHPSNQSKFTIEGDQRALKKEILELRSRLENQFVLRSEMEKALIGAKPFRYGAVVEKSIPKPAKELIQEIATLEIEVAYLEQQLLSLYRAVLDPPQSTEDERDKLSIQANKTLLQEFSTSDILYEDHGSVINRIDIQLHEKISGQFLDRYLKLDNEEGHQLTASKERCQSSLAEHFLASTSPKGNENFRADSGLSLPLLMLEDPRNVASGGDMMSDHLHGQVNKDLWKTPNRLSEEIITTISHIYCELEDSPYSVSDYTATPFIISLLQNEVLSRGQSDVYRYPYENFDSFISSLESSFHIGDSQEVGVPYNSMRMVQGISKNSRKLNKIQHELQAFRSLAYQLELVNPGNLNHEEKLAFWINIHNALVMHAFLVNGIPKSGSKRLSISLKAAYNVGGHFINVEKIQNSILQCQLLRPRQWLWPLLSPKLKSKQSDSSISYAIDHQEPRLHFALCSGNYSDPAVRNYTPSKVYEELEIAKDEYIQSNIIFHKETKIFLPKLIQCFAKDQDLPLQALLDTAEHLLPESVGWCIRQFPPSKLRKIIEWIPHDFSFRYRFSKELS